MPASLLAVAHRGPAPGVRQFAEGSLNPGDPLSLGEEKHFAYGEPAGYFKTSGVWGECSLAAEVGSNYCIAHILSCRDEVGCKGLILLLG